MIASAIAVFAIVGALFIVRSHAATVAMVVEAESGTLGGNYASLSGSKAPGATGSAVLFGAQSPTPPAPTTPPSNVSAATPCVGAAAPAQWKHVILLMFENEVASDVIGTAEAPYITNLANKCATAQGWKDGNIRVDGSTDGNYNSKPSYATLTSGVSPSVSGIVTNDYGKTSSVDNIFNRLNQLGKQTKSYQSGPAGGCAASNFEGAYHDALRYYDNLGGQSSSSSTYCNTHDVTLGSLMADINAGNLPAFSLLLPTNNQNMHNNGVASGDSYAQTLLDPILNSAQYKSGDTAIFFLWDEESPIPNVLLAPSIMPGSKASAPAGGNPITHFTFTRTSQEMLGVTPLLGVSGQAPSLLNFFNGK